MGPCDDRPEVILQFVISEEAWAHWHRQYPGYSDRRLIEEAIEGLNNDPEAIADAVKSIRTRGERKEATSRHQIAVKVAIAAETFYRCQMALKREDTDMAASSADVLKSAMFHSMGWAGKDDFDTGWVIASLEGQGDMKTRLSGVEVPVRLSQQERHAARVAATGAAIAAGAMVVSAVASIGMLALAIWKAA